MSRTYKMVTLVGCAPESYEAAINNALADASKSLRGLAWFEVIEMRGKVEDGKVAEYQVKVSVGFSVES